MLRSLGLAAAPALLAGSLLAGSLLAGPGAGDAATVPPSTNGDAPATYTNPMTLAIGDGTVAETCADPEVVAAQEPDTGWFLFCTSDPLVGGDVLEFHHLPIFTSDDLVTWDYAGDAFAAPPSWVSGGMWAPEVAYLDGQYLLYYTASNTRLPGGGSAIGVATAPSPTGPWTDTGVPAVAPAPHPTDEFEMRWTFDAEIVEIEDRPWIFFGSYHGGLFARQLSADGVTSRPESEVQIAIDNRYEGTNIVERDGWYYLLASATACCAGPRTGYSVFAARSRDPLGPYVDRAGVSILESRPGGTPVLQQNGNRWIGAGHHTVVTDEAGQDWIVYHAIDPTDPYLAGPDDPNQRPALIDPLDWVEGWPVVRSGLGPSDTPQPAPAAQPGDTATYVPSPPPPDTAVGDPVADLVEDFDDPELGAAWSWTRPPADDEYTVADGVLAWNTQAGDLQPTGETASILAAAAPAGDYVVETKVAVSVPVEGCCFNYVQGGIVVFADDLNYVKLGVTSIWNTRQTEFGTSVSPVPDGYPTYGNGVVGPVADETYLRVVKRTVGDVDHFTAHTSIDGEYWSGGGTWTLPAGSADSIGLVSMGGTGFVATFDYVRVSELATP